MENPDANAVVGDDDLALLPDLDENILLQNLRTRYERDAIYTYVGDILLAVNPFKAMPNYGDEVAEKYRNVRHRSQMRPHIFAIGDHMYRSMRTSMADQVCVISGESGAGKTESAKLVVKQVLNVSRSIHPDLQAQILKVNPLLEALGNARTVMNNNSSRFGKFLKLHFNENAAVTGASMAHYLLEKSRVVTQNEGERNFHIFYLMFAGLSNEEKLKYELSEPAHYRYLKTSEPILNRELGQMKEFFKEVTNAMTVVGFDDEDYNHIFNLLAAILHLGQFTFSSNSAGAAQLRDKDVLVLVSQLLCLEPAALAKALTVQVTITRGETILKPNTTEMASEFRDSLAKFLYGRFFAWVVKSLNLMLSPSSIKQLEAHILHESDTFRGTDICILDIFGFEHFKVNSFEQYCINVANEQLQYYFNQHIFRWEQEEYNKEGITAPGTFQFADNKPIIELFFAKPMGMFSLLDEETKFPRASAKSLMDKFNSHCDKNPYFVKARTAKTPCFSVKHYAGQVMYQCDSFLTKNRDAISEGLMDCIKKSTDELIQAIVSDNDTESERANHQVLLDCESPMQAMRNNKLVSKVLRNPRSRIGKSVRRCTSGNPNANSCSESRRGSATGPHLIPEGIVDVLTVPGSNSTALQRTRSKRQTIKASMRKRPQRVKKASPTIAFYIKSSLASLMEKMLISMPHFVRCLKPNSLLIPGMFDDKLVTVQLSYTGVLETTRIRQLGYPTRLEFSTFMERYKCLQKHTGDSTDEEASGASCSALLDTLDIKDYAVGETKIFLRYHHNETLFNLVERREKSATTMQKVVRGFLARRYFQHSIVEMFCQEISDAMENIGAKLQWQASIDEGNHQARLEEARLERERLEKLRFEKERLERERLQREKEEKERAEAAAVAARLEQECLLRLEQERKEAEQRAREEAERQQLKKAAEEKECMLRMEQERKEAEQREKEDAERLLLKQAAEERAERQRLQELEQRLAQERERDAAAAAAAARAKPGRTSTEREFGMLSNMQRRYAPKAALTAEEVTKARTEAQQVESETAALRLARQNLLNETEALLKEANDLRNQALQEWTVAKQRLTQTRRLSSVNSDEVNLGISSRNNSAWSLLGSDDTGHDSAFTATRTRSDSDHRPGFGRQDSDHTTRLHSSAGLTGMPVLFTQRSSSDTTEPSSVDMTPYGGSDITMPASSGRPRSGTASATSDSRTASRSNSTQGTLAADTAPGSKSKSKRPWCVVTVMERERVAGTYSIYPRNFAIDGSEKMTSSLIGLNSYPVTAADDSVMKVRPFIGKGIELEISSDGSVLVTRRSKNNVMVKGRSPSLLHCHQNAQLTGDVLPRDTPQEVFSAQIFKQHVKEVMGKPKVDLTVLFCLCRVALSFVKNNSSPQATPCWVVLDFVVPHLKVNDYLQKKGIQTKRSVSPWSQADIFDPKLLCFTTPVSGGLSIMPKVIPTLITRGEESEATGPGSRAATPLASRANFSTERGDQEDISPMSAVYGKRDSVVSASPTLPRKSLPNASNISLVASPLSRSSLAHTVGLAQGTATHARMWAKRNKAMPVAAESKDSTDLP